MTKPTLLEPAERAAVLDVFDRLDRPKITNYAPLGWPIMLGALLVQGILIWLLGRLGINLSAAGRMALLVVTGLAALAGLGFLLFGASAVRSVPETAAQGAIALLTGDGARDPLTRRRAAVTLLDNAFTSGGPWTLATFDAGEVARRLGTQLPYVQAVERILRTERGLWAVFTGETTEA